MSLAPDRPCLRDGLAAAKIEGDGDGERDAVVVWDQRRFSNRELRCNSLELTWLQFFDGLRTLREIQAALIYELGGQWLPLETLEYLAKRLDDALLLDSPRFRDHLASPIREPSCIGSYDADPRILRQQLTGLFVGANGPGLPQRPMPRLGPTSLSS